MPSVVIIDQGLPDGSGIELIRDLANAKTRVPVILATSGDDRNLVAAMDAGADGFLPKPIESLAVFQKAVLENLPNYQHPKGPRLVSNEMIQPDQIAFRDDLAHVADLLTTSDHAETIDYVAKFLTGVARSAHDHALEAAATDLAKSHMTGAAIGSDLARVAGLLQERLEGQVVI
jgi:DNA-binding response OmpR family regulator